MPLYFTLMVAAVYGLWWFTVHATAPDDANPWQSRLAVVGLIAGLWAAAKVMPAWQRRGHVPFIAAIWLVTAHYLYLCYLNAESAYWLFGLYIVVMAAASLLPNLASIATYGIITIAGSLFVVAGHDAPLHHIVVPGLVTIIGMALLGAWRRDRLLFRLHHRAAEIQRLYDWAKASEAQRVQVESNQRALRLREEYVNIIAHEFKTPLTALLLKIGTARKHLQRGIVWDEQRRSAFIDAMASQTGRLMDLVDEVLDMSRIVGGKLSLVLSRVCLTDLLHVCASQSSDTMHPWGVPIIRDLQADVWVQADADRLAQAITAQLTNAYKYGQGTPVTLNMQADAFAARIEVCDRGMLIAPRDFGRIFERFERAISEREISGLGLGLFIAKSIVEQIGGTITVASSAEEGTRFVVLLPQGAAGAPLTPR